MPFLTPFTATDTAITPHVETQTIRIPKWLNITGYGKKGKTAFLCKLMQYVPTVYFDFDDGTTDIEGWQGFRCFNKEEFMVKFSLLARYVQAHGPVPLIVLDPLDKLSYYFEKFFMAQNNLKDMGELQYGAAYRMVRDQFANMISAIKPLSKMIISITHLKHSSLGRDESQISFYDMDLTGKIKEYVMNEVDGNLVFAQMTDDITGNSYLHCRIDNLHDGGTVFSGSRIRKLYEIKRADELMTYLLKQFGIDREVHFDQPFDLSTQDVPPLPQPPMPPTRAASARSATTRRNTEPVSSVTSETPASSATPASTDTTSAADTSDEVEELFA